MKTNFKLFSKRNIRFALVFIITALIVGIYFLFKPFPAGPTLNVQANAPGNMRIETDSSMNRPALMAWTARNQGLADFYAAKGGSLSPRALEAWSARDQGLADFHAAKGGSLSPRALEAWSARDQGLADLYAVKGGSLSPRALAAWADRNQGLAEYYLVKLGTP